MHLVVEQALHRRKNKHRLDSVRMSELVKIVENVLTDINIKHKRSGCMNSTDESFDLYVSCH